MRDVDRALADIADIRSQIASDKMFRGFGPLVIAVTGGLAVLVAFAQASLTGLTSTPMRFVMVWIALAAVSACLIGAEMFACSRRHHGGLADSMTFNAIEQFVPAGLVGAALTYFFFAFTSTNVWMLPGLWQILIALGLFAGRNTLPRRVVLVGAWYLVAGLAVFALASQTQILSPWHMGLPFGGGQLLMAAMLYLAKETRHDG